MMVKVEGSGFHIINEAHKYSALPLDKIKLTDYWIGQFPVTQELWEAVLGKHENESYFRGTQRPVDRVSWEKINSTFLPKINEMTKDTRQAGTIYRLPTEAQWEFAAWGGMLSKGYKYAGGEKLDDVGWYDKNSHDETKLVGLKLPNELNLYDMSGNVWEWCRDFYSANYYKNLKTEETINNPEGPQMGDSHVLRGGSWIRQPRYCQVWNRNDYIPTYRDSFIGFRLALEYSSD